MVALTVLIIVLILGLIRRVRKLFILHLGNYLLTPDSGVAQKTYAMAEAMIKLGIDVRCVAFPFLFKGESTPHPLLEVHHVADADIYPKMDEFISQQVGADDLILFRYPLATQPLLDLMKKHGRKIVFEHNTIEGVEVLMLQKSHLSRQRFSFSPSYLKYAFNTLFLKRTDETQLGGAILKHALGGICVSHEIEKYEKSRFKSYNTTVIANGVRVMQPVSLEHLPMNGTLRVCMIIGSPAIWHGYDRLLEGLSKLTSGDVAVQLDIIGLDRPAEKLPEVPKPHSVKWCGPMSRPQIAEHVAGCHLAVGTLALHRKEMQEASPLKVRECLMMGLPMLLGYYDTDISDDKRFSDFVLTVPNDNSPIDWQRVIRFAKGLDARKDYRRVIAGLATEVLSMEGKAARYVDFMRSLKN